MIVAQEYARDVIARGAKGAIVNVSSVASFVGIPDHAAYCTSKAGVDGLMRVMAKELGPQGIHVGHVVVDGGIAGERLLSRAPQLKEERGEDGMLREGTFQRFRYFSLSFFFWVRRCLRIKPVCQ